MRTIKYNHYGADVSVRKELKGKHREYCLCHICEKFTPRDRAENCQIANIMYGLCVKLNLVTPVWECPEFKEKGNE
jgi:hypothetical protein